MATFLERAAHSVNRMFSLYLICLFVSLVISNFGIKGNILVLIAPVTGHCLHLTFGFDLSVLACGLLLVSEFR